MISSKTLDYFTELLEVRLLALFIVTSPLLPQELLSYNTPPISIPPQPPLFPYDFWTY